MLHNEARELLVRGYEATHDAEGIAKAYSVSQRTVYRLVSQKRKTGSILRVEEIGRAESFFELGGDSLMAISVLSRIKEEFGIELPIKAVMGTPILSQLAELIDQTEPAVARITARHTAKYVLLPQQKAIYAACCKNPQTLMYNMPVRVPISKNVDRDKLQRCIEDVMAHHMSLKTRIVPESDGIYGIYDETAQCTIEKYTNADYHTFLRPFILEEAPLFRIGFTEDSLLFDMYHIIADGESLNIILRDISRLYDGETVPGGTMSRLPSTFMMRESTSAR